MAEALADITAAADVAAVLAAITADPSIPRAKDAPVKQSPTQNAPAPRK
jgi:hypothetical protein